MSVNLAVIVGRLGKDPETATTPSGKNVTKFSVATSESWKDKDGQKQEKTVWHNMVAWGKVGDVIAQYLKKGQEAYFQGKIDNRSYDDKDGVKKYISEITVQTFSFVGSKGDDGSKKSAPGGDDSLPF